MARPTAHRYSIEIRDVETGATLLGAAVDWTDDQKRLAVILIGRLAKLRQGDRSEAFGSLEPRLGKRRYH